MTHAGAGFLIRDFQPPDQPGVVALLRRVLDRPGERCHDDAYFAWKHLHNPFGPSLMLVAVADEQIVGFRAIMRWRLSLGGTLVDAGRPVDTVTDPTWRRQGVFSSLTAAALRRVADLGMEVLFNTPNSQSLPGYLKMGWVPLGHAKRDLLIGGPGTLVRMGLAKVRRNGRGALPRPAVSPEEAWEQLGEGMGRRPEETHVVKDRAYLRWRYGQHPWFSYRVVRARDTSAAVRVASSRSIPTAIIAESTARGEAQWRALLWEIASETAAPLAQLMRTHPAQSPGRAAGWMRWEQPGPMLVARSERHAIPDLRSWFLTTGELEFF